MCFGRVTWDSPESPINQGRYKQYRKMTYLTILPGIVFRRRKWVPLRWGLLDLKKSRKVPPGDRCQLFRCSRTVVGTELLVALVAWAC